MKMITHDEIDLALLECFKDLTGYDPLKGQIRRAYQSEPVPLWKHKDNVLSFYTAHQTDVMDQDLTNEEAVYRKDTDDFSKVYEFVQVIECRMSFYGPGCREMATRVRALITGEENRRGLTRLKIFPVSKQPPPRYLPYNLNNRWWQRADLTLTFNVMTEIDTSVPKIASAQVTVTTDKGDTRYVNATSQTGG